MFSLLLENLTPSGALTVFVICVVVYKLSLICYRLLLSPIRHFPGSKLTAATGWYETYLDVFKGGQFTFQIQRWHEQYGEMKYSNTPLCS